MKKVQNRGNVRTDRNLRKFLTKLFHFTNGKARVECRVENHSAGWKKNSYMERNLGTDVTRGKYTTSTHENWKKKKRYYQEAIKRKQTIRRNESSPRIFIAETIFNTRELGIRSSEENPRLPFSLSIRFLFGHCTVSHLIFTGTQNKHKAIKGQRRNRESFYWQKTLLRLHQSCKNFLELHQLNSKHEPCKCTIFPAHLVASLLLSNQEHTIQQGQFISWCCWRIKEAG